MSFTSESDKPFDSDMGKSMMVCSTADLTDLDVPERWR